jgi:hypothetical protein
MITTPLGCGAIIVAQSGIVKGCDDRTSDQATVHQTVLADCFSIVPDKRP